MTSKFNLLIEEISQNIKKTNDVANFIHEAEVAPPPDQPPTDDPMGGQPPPDQAAPQAPPKAPPTSQGFAYITNIIYHLLKQPENLDPKYLKLSDNQVKTSQEAFKYLDYLMQLLPNEEKTSIKSISFDTGDQKKDVNSSKIVEMANVALRGLFHRPKNSNEFTRQMGDIDALLAETNGKVDPVNAQSVYDQIRELVGVSEQLS